MATSGRTVLFSAATVAAALSSLFVFPDATMRSLGIAGIAVVLACMAAAVTLMPALLGRFGHRLGVAAARVRPRLVRAARPAHPAPRRARRGRREPVPARCWPSPFLNARFDNLDVKSLPKSSETRQVAEAIDARFPGVTQEPVWIVADVASDDPTRARVRRRGARPRRRARRRRQRHLARRRHRDRGLGRGRDERPDLRARRRGSARARARRSDFQVGGDPAETVDFRQALASRIPWAIAIIVIATFVLLFLMTGSVVIPAKAIVMNVLSLGATFGALVWVFQDGHLSGLLGFDPPGALDLIMPVVVFVFAFGLSMDYEVFMLARIKEAYDDLGRQRPARSRSGSSAPARSSRRPRC